MLLEEFDAGVVRGTVGAMMTGNAGSGLELLSLDISAEDFAALDEAGAPLPTDGQTGRLCVRHVAFADNGDKDITTFGVEVRGDVRLPAFPPRPPESEVDYTVTVLHNNDGESDLLGDDDGAGSISRFGRLLFTQKRMGNQGPDAGVVSVTAGDNFLASPS